MARKKHHEGHGGAWKVAYADFVTAMMALFMVLWISAQQKEILLSASKYFQNPFTSPMPASSGVMDGKKEKVDTDPNGSPTHIFTAEMYMALAKEFLKMMDIDTKAQKEKPIEIHVTTDGIVITLFNRAKQPIFDKGTTQLTKWGEYACQNLSWIIDRFRMRVRIDAHAPKDVLPPTDTRDSWDLTAEQSNVIRRQLVHYGLEQSKVDRVSGFGDTKPEEGLSAEDPENYRIELTLTATDETPSSGLRKSDHQ